MLVVAILVLLVALLLLGMPLVFAMGSTAVIYLYIADIHLSMLAQRMTSAVDSFLILAIPFFYLAGELMNACKLTDRIVAMAKALVGHIQGGLAQVNIVASMIFAGMSGSATADTAALGSVLIPAMQKEGYHADFSAAVTVASAMIGPIIPSSVAMVIFGAVADVSIGRLLLAGILPGVLIGITQSIRKLKRERGVWIPCLNLWRLMTPAQWAELHGERGTAALGHGGDPLTSAYQHLFPELMRMDLIEMKDKKPVLGLPPSGLNSVRFEGVDVHLAIDIDDICDTGIADGDPNNSSAEIGEKIVEYLVDFSAKFVTYFNGVESKT